MSIPSTLSLNIEQYDALVALARKGTTTDPNGARALEGWLKLIEEQNGIVRDLVVVIWQELDSPLPAGTFFPTKWPPELKRTIELVSRPIARADVDKVLAAYAKKPTSVLCTRDPAGILGLTPIDDFFIN
jgi:hypothetical protein